MTPSLVSPEVHPDRRVTFRIRAPEASKVMVVGGNLAEALGGPKALTKGDDGVWSVTVGPLPPDIYSYGFSIGDSTRFPDPANETFAQSSWGPASLVEIPGDEPQFYSFRDVPHGAVTTHTYRSKELDAVRQFCVYTPPGHERGDATYPALYLYHGGAGDETQWATVGRTNLILDNLIADGKAVPMVIVMPYGYVPRREGSNPTADVEKDLLEDVMPMIERLYRVKADRTNRAIAGLPHRSGGHEREAPAVVLRLWHGGSATAVPDQDGRRTAEPEDRADLQELRRRA